MEKFDVTCSFYLNFNEGFCQEEILLGAHLKAKLITKAFTLLPLVIIQSIVNVIKACVHMIQLGNQ